MRFALAVALALLVAPPVRAQDEEKKRLEDLEKQVAELVKRVKALEEQIASSKKPAGPAPVYSAMAGAMGANERLAALSLKTLATAEADFRTNDRDSNGIHDFWVGDVSGLYRYTVNNKEIKLIEKSLADADGSALKSPILSTLKRDQPVPKAGYLFAVVAKYAEKEKTETYHAGGFRSNHKFGFVAYPAEYGKTGRLSFAISEGNAVWKKDLAGAKGLEVLPENPGKEEWEKAD